MSRAKQIYETEREGLAAAYTALSLLLVFAGWKPAVRIAAILAALS